MRRPALSICILDAYVPLPAENSGSGSALQLQILHGLKTTIGSEELYDKDIKRFKEFGKI